MPKELGQSAKKGSVLGDLWMEEETDETLPQLKEDPRRWREFERDKTRKKRDRRRLLPGEEED